jgi:hypothetical protein
MSEKTIKKNNELYSRIIDLIKIQNKKKNTCISIYDFEKHTGLKYSYLVKKIEEMIDLGLIEKNRAYLGNEYRILNEKVD